MELRRVVITGMGAITSVGNNVPDFWTSLREGKSGIGPVTLFPITDQYTARIAGEVKNFDPSSFLERKESRKMDRFTQFAVGGAVEAMRDAGLENGGYDPERSGCVLGNGIGGLDALTEAIIAIHERGPRRIPVLSIPKSIGNIAPGSVSIRFNLQGPCFAVTTACCSGTDAIGNSLWMIRHGVADLMVTGGTESPVVPFALGGFCVMQAVATKFNDTPEKASRPFDKDREGFVLGEGAGILVLEELEHAKRRGARILAEVAGYGLSCDAHHITAPHPEGRGAIAAITMALRDAGVAPTDVDYINAHGTSTPLNDPTETLAIKKVFGDHAYKLKVSSTKSMTGHPIAAAGAIEAVACVLAMRDSFYPPTINLDEPDPVCDLDYVPNKGVAGNIDVCMSNSLGFGGHNGVLVLKKFAE